MNLGNKQRYLGRQRVHLNYLGGVQNTREITGVVKNSGTPVERTVLAIDRITGSIVDWAKSDTDGNYTLFISSGAETLLVCLDDTAGTVQNDLIKRVQAE